MKNVLVLCTGNSCRSIMAETMINELSSGAITAVSAGSHPTGSVHPLAISTLKRHGFNPVNAQSKSWDVFSGYNFDAVITVCDQAATETCPVFTGSNLKLHWSTPDPAAAVGDEQTVQNAFDTAFKQLKKRIENELL